MKNVVMKSVVMFLMVSALAAFGAEPVSFEEDKDFISTGFNLWELDANDLATSGTPEAYVDASKALLAGYKAGEIPFGNFRHSPKGLDALFFLMDATMRLYQEELQRSSSLREFRSLDEKNKITIRYAMIESTSYFSLKLNIADAIDSAIVGTGSGDASAEELQYVYQFHFKWMEIISLQEQASGPSTGKEYIKFAQKALKKVQKIMTGPSEASLKTVVFVVKRTIDLLVAIEKKTGNLDEFLHLFQTNSESVQDAFIQGLVKYQSLTRTLKDVDDAVNRAIGDL